MAYLNEIAGKIGEKVWVRATKEGRTFKEVLDEELRKLDIEKKGIEIIDNKNKIAPEVPVQEQSVEVEVSIDAKTSQRIVNDINNLTSDLKELPKSLSTTCQSY